MRRQDWPEALAAFIAERQGKPFAWGSNDCAHFAADWIKACTGEAVSLPSFTSAASAMRALEQLGGMHAAVSAALGDPLAVPALAQRGDVALLEVDGRDFLGVIESEYVAAPGPEGLRMLPRTAITAAWKVGRG